jgi:hypothetical protein
MNASIDDNTQVPAAADVALNQISLIRSQWVGTRGLKQSCLSLSLSPTNEWSFISPPTLGEFEGVMMLFCT